MLLAGAVFAAAAVAGGELVWVPLVIATYATAVMAGALRDVVPRSRWRVPQSWGRFSRSIHAALFGGVLGLGVLTAMPSIAFFAVLAWPAAAQDVLVALTPALFFGLARATPLLVSWGITASTAQLVAAVNSSRRLAEQAIAIEALVLAAFTATLWMDAVGG